MIYKVIIEKEYQWETFQYDGYQVSIKGYLFIDDVSCHGMDATIKLVKLLRKTSESNLVKILLLRLTGHYSVIVESHDYVIAFVDKIRSIPLYFSESHEQFIVSNSAYSIQNLVAKHCFSKDSSLLFLMTGYCLQNDTLIENIKQLRPGQFLLVNKKESTLQIEHYYRYFNPIERKTDRTILLDELNKVISKTFDKMIESLEGRHVMIPLSGGYDSRFILGMLKDRGYDNVSAYSYGINGLWEVKRAKKIAEMLNIRWTYVEFIPSDTRKLFDSSERRKYYRYAGGLNSAPHLPDYHAIKKLLSQGLIPHDAIFINGQSGDFITGGHIPPIVKLNEDKGFSIEDVLQALLDKHFSLWINLKSENNLKLAKKRISESLQDIEFDNVDSRIFSKLYELFEFEERQSKFVVNGQRIYDYFGFDWRLPLWSDEIIRFWETIDWKTKYGQELYLEYLKIHNFGGVFNNVSLPPQYTYFPKWTLIPRTIFKGLSLIYGRDVTYYYQKYLKYYQAYGPFYPDTSYLNHLKNSEYHRNPISYAAKEYLEEITENKYSVFNEYL
jgi:asparagine synthase (glutamine-hydrolysing)